MFRPTAVLDATREYLRRNPQEIARAVRSAAGLRVGVPIAALRWLGRELERSGKVANLVIDSVPAGIRVGADVDLMQTPVRARATVYVERLRVSGEEATVAVRLEDVDMVVIGDAQTPVSALLRSGALDLSKPGNLVAHFPGAPPILVQAKDNRIVLDFMKDPKLADNALVRAFLGVLTSFLTVHAVASDSDHVDVSLRALPSGVFGAVRAVRQHILSPSMKRLKG